MATPLIRHDFRCTVILITTILLNCPLKRGKLSFKAIYSLQKFVVLYGGTVLETHFQLSSQVNSLYKCHYLAAIFCSHSRKCYYQDGFLPKKERKKLKKCLDWMIWFTERIAVIINTRMQRQ